MRFAESSASASCARLRLEFRRDTELRVLLLQFVPQTRHVAREALELRLSGGHGVRDSRGRLVGSIARVVQRLLCVLELAREAEIFLARRVILLPAASSAAPNAGQPLGLHDASLELVRDFAGLRLGGIQRRGGVVEAVAQRGELLFQALGLGLGGGAAATASAARPAAPRFFAAAAPSIASVSFCAAATDVPRGRASRSWAALVSLPGRAPRILGGFSFFPAASASPRAAFASARASSTAAAVCFAASPAPWRAAASPSASSLLARAPRSSPRGSRRRRGGDGSRRGRAPRPALRLLVALAPSARLLSPTRGRLQLLASLFAASAASRAEAASLASWRAAASALCVFGLLGAAAASAFAASRAAAALAAPCCASVAADLAAAALPGARRAIYRPRGPRPRPPRRLLRRVARALARGLERRGRRRELPLAASTSPWSFACAAWASEVAAATAAWPRRRGLDGLGLAFAFSRAADGFRLGGPPFNASTSLAASPRLRRCFCAAASACLSCRTRRAPRPLRRAGPPLCFAALARSTAPPREPSERLGFLARAWTSPRSVGLLARRGLGVAARRARPR